MDLEDLGFFGCLGILLLAFGADCLIGWIFMLLWNWIAPIFWVSAPILTFWQGVGCVILLELIGSFFKSSSND